ncbi:MAG: beta-N-acetylhexosaminidase [Treponema sp.]|nr:beta-N-acetylhexosaminidase [Treponema sp.]
MNKNCNLVPFPLDYVEGKTSCKFGNQISVSGDLDCLHINSINSLLESFGFSLIVENTADSGAFVKTVLAKDNLHENYDLSTKDSYFLEVKSQEVLVVSKSQSGLFYGLVTLAQLLMNGNEIACCKIYDKPEYEWRGFMLDTSRTFYSTDFLKKVIRLCAFHKMNKFHWHLTDDQGWRIHIDDYPLLTQIGSVRRANTNPIGNVGDYDGVKFPKYYYSDQDITEIVEYAKAFNVEIIPEVEFPGHSSALLAAYPEYGCTKGPYAVETRWGIFDDVLCLGNDKVFDLYNSILTKVTKLFPSEYIHIGGDECPTKRWNECPACQKRIAEMKLKNESELQSWGTKKITDLIVSFGKKPIGWDEVLDNTESIPLNESVVVQSWRGIEGGERASALNHKVIMSPGQFCYLDHKPLPTPEEPGRLAVLTLDETYNFNPVTKNMSEKSSKFVMGGEATLFTEEVPYSRYAEYLMLPRLCSLAECLWLNPDCKNWERFKLNVTEHKVKLEKLGFIHS